MASLIDEVAEAIKAKLIADSEIEGKVYIGVEGESPKEATFPHLVVSPGPEPQRRSASGGEKTYKPEFEIYIYTKLTNDEINLLGKNGHAGHAGLLATYKRIEATFEGDTLGDLVDDIYVINGVPGELITGKDHTRSLGYRVDLVVEYHS